MNAPYDTRLALLNMELASLSAALAEVDAYTFKSIAGRVVADPEIVKRLLETAEAARVRCELIAQATRDR